MKCVSLSSLFVIFAFACAPAQETKSPETPAQPVAPATPAPAVEASASSAPTPPPVWKVNDKDMATAGSPDIKDAVEKAGWKSEGYTYGGVVGTLEQYGVSATKESRKVQIGFTRTAKTPKEVPAAAKNYDRKTLYKLAAMSKDPQLSQSMDEDGVFFWVVLDKGATAADATSLFQAVFVKGK